MANPNSIIARTNQGADFPIEVGDAAYVISGRSQVVQHNCRGAPETDETQPSHSSQRQLWFCWSRARPPQFTPQRGSWVFVSNGCPSASSIFDTKAVR